MANKDNNTLMIILVIILVLLLFGGLGMGGFSGGMMRGDNFGFVFLGWIFNIIISVIIIFLLVLGVYWLFKNINFNKLEVKLNGKEK